MAEDFGMDDKDDSDGNYRSLIGYDVEYRPEGISPTLPSTLAKSSDYLHDFGLPELLDSALKVWFPGIELRLAM